MMTVRTLKGFAEGPQAYGATVARVESFGFCEDGRTLAVTVELNDGRLAMFQFCPGDLITASVVSHREADDVKGAR